MISKLSDAIARSIRHDEIAHVDLGDLLDREQTAEYRTASNEWDMHAFGGWRRHLVRGLLSRARHQGAHCYDAFDDVENNDTWEMWGTTEDGDYRVHIRLDR